MLTVYPPGSRLEFVQHLPQRRNNRGGSGGRDRQAGRETHVINMNSRLFRNRKTIMACRRSEEATMDHARYYNDLGSFNAALALLLSLSATTFLLISPRSPVDSNFLPFPRECLLARLLRLQFTTLRSRLPSSHISSYHIFSP